MQHYVQHHRLRLSNFSAQLIIHPCVCLQDKVKSINSCKSFNATSNLSEIERWMGVLCEELAERMAADEDEYRRHAKTLGDA